MEQYIRNKRQGDHNKGHFSYKGNVSCRGYFWQAGFTTAVGRTIAVCAPPQLHMTSPFPIYTLAFVPTLKLLTDKCGTPHSKALPSVTGT